MSQTLMRSVSRLCLTPSTYGSTLTRLRICWVARWTCMVASFPGCDFNDVSVDPAGVIAIDVWLTYVISAMAKHSHYVIKTSEKIS